jgi:SAM-dependent methyltransferase
MIAMKSGASNKILSGEELQRVYEARFEGRFDYRNKVWKVLIRDFFQKYIRQDDTVLDLGAGYGEFINHIACGKKFAMDLNPDTATRVNASVQLLAQDCSEPWPLPDNSLDVIFTSNFFEHLPNIQALSRTLAEVHRCLKQGGILIAMGPNITYTGNAYWEVVDHQLALSDESFAQALVSKGFMVERRVARFLPFTMSEGLQYPTLFVAAYLRLPFAWRIFGKQFLVIGRKDSV